MLQIQIIYLIRQNSDTTYNGEIGTLTARRKYPRSDTRLLRWLYSLWPHFPPVVPFLRQRSSSSRLRPQEIPPPPLIIFLGDSDSLTRSTCSRSVLLAILKMDLYKFHYYPFVYWSYKRFINSHLRMRVSRLVFPMRNMLICSISRSFISCRVSFECFQKAEKYRSFKKQLFEANKK